MHINNIFYLIAFHKQINFTTITILIIATIFYLISRSRLSNREIFFLSWAAACYVLFTAIGTKEPRYIIYWVSALCALAALSAPRWAASLATRLGRDSSPHMDHLHGRPDRGALCPPVPYLRVSGGGPLPLVPGVPQERESVFYDGNFNGYGAIVFARQADPMRRVFFFRSSKFLFAKAIFAHYALWKLRNKEEDLKEF